ncbi:hypothetical protein BOO69_13420 [Sulfitobacter alexandrii]|uniref:Gamma-glutamyl kinase n=1 Tax=Sulfitobacter alexandrii TaxID=1917485 RepID=A0A1J0WJ07_9RHOB|nr:hypothetical protein [Sulfitobacter alexandrii]APE44285.1 hypothetical protein BOO69_13420 [Sulfitobacter alexandrii]
MLIFLRHGLAFLATPKTGTTAVEMALRPKAEIVFAKNRKHVTALRFSRKIAPFLEDTFGVRPEAVAIMRDPTDQIASWYRYRGSDRLLGTDLSTRDISFDTYVREVIGDDPPPRAQIGSQFNFLTDGKETVMAQHIFAYTHQADFRRFMSDRLRTEVTLKPRNVSPGADTGLSAETLARLREARAPEFALYDRVLAQGGHLITARD